MTTAPIAATNEGARGLRGRGATAAARPVPGSEFERWFGCSAVVDRHGAPLRVYHGTVADFRAFAPAPGGIYFTDRPRRAAVYAEHATDSVVGVRVLPVYLSMQRPLRLTLPRIRALGRELGVADVETFAAGVEDSDEVHRDRVRQYAHERGHDGLILARDLMPHGPDGDWGFIRSYVVFRPQQIKSVFNAGTFDPSDPDILR